TAIYTLSLHDALPISAPVLSLSRTVQALFCRPRPDGEEQGQQQRCRSRCVGAQVLERARIHDGLVFFLTSSPFAPFHILPVASRSEEHTSELQSQSNL